jgi:hypothetical protein
MNENDILITNRYQGASGQFNVAMVGLGASIPIVALFYIDHLFSCILGQKPELGLSKGEFYHSSMFITGKQSLPPCPLSSLAPTLVWLLARSLDVHQWQAVATSFHPFLPRSFGCSLNRCSMASSRSLPSIPPSLARFCISLYWLHVPSLPLSLAFVSRSTGCMFVRVCSRQTSLLGSRIPTFTLLTFVRTS